MVHSYLTSTLFKWLQLLKICIVFKHHPFIPSFIYTCFIPFRVGGGCERQFTHTARVTIHRSATNIQTPTETVNLGLLVYPTHVFFYTVGQSQSPWRKSQQTPRRKAPARIWTHFYYWTAVVSCTAGQLLHQGSHRLKLQPVTRNYQDQPRLSHENWLNNVMWTLGKKKIKIISQQQWWVYDNKTLPVSLSLLQPADDSQLSAQWQHPV